MVVWICSKGNTPPFLVGVQSCPASMASTWRFLRKLGTDLPQNLGTPFLDIYLKDALSYHTNTCSNIFTLALFIITRNWKQPGCPSMEEWIKNGQYIYRREYYLAVWKVISNCYYKQKVELEINHADRDIWDPEKHILCVFTYKWASVVK